MLTDAALRALKPRPKPYKVTDRDGMYVHVAPSVQSRSGSTIAFMAGERQCNSVDMDPLGCPSLLPERSASTPAEF